ncbi:MAG TPA: pyridoxamine 5'-phosphate oxidase family protein [Longimicrobiales bacterium]
MQHSPYIRELDRTEVDAILKRNSVGRLAFASRSLVDIEPVNYVYQDGWVYGRTSAGTKISAVATNWWVAFEVDESDALFQWRSVVAHGGFYRLYDGGREIDRERYRTAIAALRTLVPATLQDEDPVPYRTIIFGILLQETRGKECALKSAQQEIPV